MYFYFLILSNLLKYFKNRRGFGADLQYVQNRYSKLCICKLLVGVVCVFESSNCV